MSQSLQMDLLTYYETCNLLFHRLELFVLFSLDNYSDQRLEVRENTSSCKENYETAN